MYKNTLLFFLLLISLYIDSQNTTHYIRGKVVSENQISLIDVRVVNENSNTSTLTDENGFFEIGCKPAESYILTFSHLGYQTKNIKVPNSRNNLTIELTLDFNELPEITIDGRSLNTLREKLDVLHLKNNLNPSVNNGIESLLVTMGGVSTNNELSSQYNVRGGNFDENVVYINGIEMMKPFLLRNAQQEGLSFIDPLMVNKIEFSRGGFTSEYGDKMSSVLDIGYKKPKRKTEGSINVNMMGGGVYLGNSSERFAQITSLRYKTTKSLLNTNDTKGEYDPKFTNVQTFMSYHLSNKLEVSFLGNYDNSIYKFAPQSRETKFGTMFDAKNFYVDFDGAENDQFVSYQGALTLKYKPNDKLTLNISASAFGSQEHEKYDIRAKYVLSDSFIDNSQEYGVLGEGTYQEYARNRLKSNIYTVSHSGIFTAVKNEWRWGVSIQNERISDHINEWQLRDSISYQAQNNYDILSLENSIYSQNKILSTRIAAYLQDTYRHQSSSGLWIFNLGLRASYWNFNEETLISPRGMIAYIPAANDNWVFRLSGGLYYQTPVYKEIQYLTPNKEGATYVLNENIKSQRSIHLVFGNDFYFKMGENQLKLTSEIYYKKLSDLNPYTINNVKIEYLGRNIGKGYTAGADFRLYGEFIKGIDSWLSFSLMKTEQKFEGKKIPLATDQLYNIAFFIQDYMPGYERLSVSLKGIFADGFPFFSQPSTFSNTYFRYPAYKRVDLGFSWQLLGEEFAIRQKSNFWNNMREIWLGVDFFNVLDMKNTNTYYWVTDISGGQYAVPNYLTGRQINLKLSMSF